ncbi:unnamed protein product [Trichogramma brassicae]|uniref:Uncharacterized protein n=1 Tax=Trichogramma brassicae TaxID=86971 RepID=A0A6H5IJB1_9HYME|nr:unnamed protein product [Trichogramma brassicae]
MKRGSPPEMIAAATTSIILSAPLLTAKDAPLPSPADFATGSCEEKWTRVNGLVRGLAAFIEGRGNLHREVTRYTQSLVQAVLALNKTKKSLEPTRPSTPDKAVGTPPMFAGGMSSKRPAQSPPATRAAPKRHTATAPHPRKLDENNNEAVDQDGFSLVDRRRRRQRCQPAAAADETASTRQQPKPRPTTRKIHHRPDAIVIKARDASHLCQHPAQTQVGADVAAISREQRPGASDAVLLEPWCCNSEEARCNQDAAEGICGKTQAAVAALPDDLAAKALKTRPHTDWLGKLPHPWSRGCPALLPLLEPRPRLGPLYGGSDRSANCFRCGKNRPSDKGLQQQPSVRILPGARRCPRPCVHKPVLPSRTEVQPSPSMMRILQLNLNHCRAAQDLLSQTILEQNINVWLYCVIST